MLPLSVVEELPLFEPYSQVRILFTYGYDGAGRMTGLTNPFSETTGWAYFDNNSLQTQTLSNGATTNYTYNAQGQLARLLNQKSGTTLSDFSSLAYDGVGNEASVTATLPGQEVSDDLCKRH